MPDAPKSPITSFMDAVFGVLTGPVEFVREKIVVPNQKQYPWYHRKFRRVPTIDQCYEDDAACIFEADQQFKRDRLVDNEILNVLRQRYEDCVLYEEPDHDTKCKPIFDAYQEATTNWFIKYGDLGAKATVEEAFMKQKHRLLWERRYGPVGTGMNQKPSGE